MWSQGDYPAVARLLQPAAIQLTDACALRPGVELLDVAAGTGNFALAAAARGANVTASDMTPRMIELGRARTVEAGLNVDWTEGDAEALPFPDERFDVVASVFGAMFAPQPDLVASELFRVCRRGGTVAMANYNRTGFLGGMATLFDRYSSRQLAVDIPSPFDWGDEQTVRARFAPFATHIDTTPDTITWPFTSVDACMEFWERTNAPTLALRMTVEPERYAAFQRDARELMHDLNTADADGVVLDSAYLLVIATK
jgi:2-polyprenyl-6-hydroxyphenyl methylase/3-demethylubiquinone-9 3-methyltransferase